MSGPSLEEISGLLRPGETAVLVAPALRRVVLQLFSKCAVALTDRRVLVVAPVWPRGYGIDVECDREKCAMLGRKKRIDGSTVLALGFEDETISLFLAKKEREQVELLVASLGEVVKEEPEAAVLAQAEAEAEDFADAVDTFEKVHGPEALDEAEEALQELAALSELSIDEPRDEPHEKD